jgi:hypothetical protein
MCMCARLTISSQRSVWRWPLVDCPWRELPGPVTASADEGENENEDV